MRYAELSCTEFYSCYLKQCHSIDLFSYGTTGHDQKGHMNKDCPSFCSEVFLELALQFFSGTPHGVRGPCGVVYDKARFFEKCFTLKMGKIGQAQASLNVQESSVFFSVLYFFISLVYNESLYYCNSYMLEQILYFGKFWFLRYGPKMLLANQIAGFFNQLQDSRIGCISQRN